MHGALFTPCYKMFLVLCQPFWEIGKGHFARGCWKEISKQRNLKGLIQTMTQEGKRCLVISLGIKWRMCFKLLQEGVTLTSTCSFPKPSTQGHVCLFVHAFFFCLECYSLARLSWLHLPCIFPSLGWGIK